MAGYPFAGKSVVAREIAEKLPYQSEIIDPKQFHTPEYEKMDEEGKRIENISVWEVGIDTLQKEIDKSSDSNIVIFDTACANRDRMAPLIQAARKKGHHTILLFVEASEESRMRRQGERQLPESVIDKYKESFERNIPLFSKMVHKVFCVGNDEDVPPVVNKIVEYIVGYYG